MTLFVFAATAAVCALSAEPLCGPASPNLLTNGDFGTVDLSGWSLDCPEGACSVEPDSFGAGGQFRRTIVENPYATLRQTLQLTPGRYAFAYSIRDSTVLSSHSVPNELTVKLGSLQVRHFLGAESIAGFGQFASNGGSTEISFEWFTLYFSSNVSQSMVLDDIWVQQLDDGGAAQSANASLAAARSGALSFVETILGAKGTSDTRLAARPVATMVAGPAMARSATSRAWALATHTEADWDDFNTTARSTSVTGGIETDAGPAWSVGFAAAISDRDTALAGPVSAVSSKGHAASFALYGTWAPDEEAYFVRAVAGGGFSSRDHRRSTYFGPESAAAGIDGAHWFASAEAGYAFEAGRAPALTPYFRLTGLQAREDGYTEIDSLGGTGAQTVEGSTQDSLSTQLGLRAALRDVWRSDVWRSGADLELHGAWRHEFLDVGATGLTFIDPAGPTASIRLPGLKEARDTAVFGIALEAMLGDRTSLFVRYDGESGGDHSVNSGQIGLRELW